MVKRTIFRRGAALLLVSVLVLGTFTACGKNKETNSSATTGNTTADSSAAEGETQKIRIAWWGNQVRNDTTLAALDAYTAEHPNVTFETEFSDWSGYWDKMATQAASDNLPDIIQQDYAYVAQYQQKNQLANLDSYVSSGALNVSDVNESVLSAGKMDGSLYALVAGVNAVCSVYNTDMLGKAGLTISDHPTYSEVKKLAAEMKEKLGVSTDMPAGEWAVQMMARDKGEVLFDSKNAKLGVSEATMLQYFKDIDEEINSDWGLTIDVLQEATTAGVEGSPIATGKTWIAFPASNQIAAIRNANKDKLDMTMYIKTDDATKESMYLRPSMFWSVAESSKNKDTAVDVINFFTNSEKAQDKLKAERGVPISSKIAKYMEPSLDEVQKQQFDYIAKVSEVATPIDPPYPAGSNEVITLLGELTDSVRYHESKPEDAAAKFIKDANDILAKKGQ
ncbi:ABC transporter substrate-binding protein [Anaerocolumna sp. MB42-C2]|uniref:ABC transporter substrate-binding protein n=1 Tax=Anaerocolumna sp. MB42-C2 TaxID=3070997 RepID=UPI0027DFEC8C|nr:extracellular solute-binding protein [Anaerocolumna sp. MB42-C2]WMJ85329.1 extracellular solute-binding protein [Anaerocolumna sp. MB42-C2]